MKKLVTLLFLLSNFVFSQNNIEIRLVDSTVGYPLFQDFYYPLNISNDAGLNAIFTTHNVNGYTNNVPHPYGPYLLRTHIILGSTSQELINDLNAYSSVIESAKLTTDYEFTDAVILKLNNINIGYPIGDENNIIITNDSGLNTIFQNFNVFYYTQKYPSINDNNLSRVFDVVCNCDKNQLLTALMNYNSVIELSFSSFGGAFLSNNTFEKPKAIISPNPFSNNFSIESEQNISNYEIIDVTGKKIISTNQKSNLDTQVSKLHSGMYILALEYDNGQTSTYKLLKK